MSEAERKDLLVMKAAIENYLLKIDDQILDYGPKENDEDFYFLLKKAVQFRNSLISIDSQLNQHNE